MKFIFSSLMDTRRGFGRLFNRIAAAARRWAAQLRPSPAKATIPPLQPVRLLAKAEPIPADPAKHAVQFAEDWYDRLEFHSRRPCGNWASPSIASVPTTSTTISGTPPSIRKSEQAAGIPPAHINLNNGLGIGHVGILMHGQIRRQEPTSGRFVEENRFRFETPFHDLTPFSDQ